MIEKEKFAFIFAFAIDEREFFNESSTVYASVIIMDNEIIITFVCM
jgi:hypothetical protein